MARAPATVTPILLPEAFKQYSKEDEDRTRKLIEQAIRDLASTHNITNAIVQAGDFGSGFFPTSGILAEALGVGDASHPPRVQIKNPGASGKIVKVYELYISLAAAATPAFRGIYTASPSDMTTGANYVVANSIRLDAEDSSAIVSIVSGAGKGSVITPGSENFYGAGTAESQAGWEWVVIREAGAFPLSIKQGEAVEFVGLANGAGEKLRIMCVLDEVPA